MSDLIKQNAIPDLSSTSAVGSAAPERDPFADIPLPKSEFDVTPIGKPDVEGATKAEEPFNLSTAVTRIMAPAAEHIGRGVDSVQTAVAGSRVLMGDGAEYANVEAQLAANKHNNILPSDTPEWAIHAADALGPVLETLPYLQKVATNAAAPAVAGGAIGSLGSPVGTMAGALVAADLSASATTAQLTAGEMYMELRRGGASHDVARNYSLAAGAVVGALQVGSGALLGGLEVASKDLFLKHPAFKNTLLRMFTKFAAVTGVTMTTAELQSATTIGTEAIAAHLTNNPHLAPKDIGKQLQATAYQMAATTPAFLATGWLGGMAVKNVRGIILPKTLPQGMKAFANTLELPGANLEAHLQNQEQKAVEDMPAESERTPQQVKDDARTEALNWLFPQEEPELKVEIPKEDTRTKGEIERDETSTQLHGEVKALIDKKNKATKALRGAVFASRTLPPGERIQYEGELTGLRQDLDKIQKDLKKAQAKEAAHETESREIEKERLENTIKNTEPKVTAGQPETRLDKIEVQKFLDKVRQYFHNQSEADKVIGDYEYNEQQGHPNSQEEQANYDAANFIANIDKRNAKGLRKLKIAKVLEEQKARKDLVDRVKKAVGGSDRTNADTDKLHIPHFSEAGVNLTGNYHQMNEVALNEEANIKERDALLEELNVHPAQQESEREHSNNVNTLYGEIAETSNSDVGAIKELLRKGRKDGFVLKLYRKAIKLVKLFPQTDANRIYIEYTDKNGSGVDVLSANQAVQLHMMLDDEKAATALIKGNGYGNPELEGMRQFQLQAQIEEQLAKIDPRYLDMMDAYRKGYYKLYGKLSKEVEKDKGYPLNKTEMFSGQLVHDSAENLTQEHFQDTIPRGRAINNSSPGTLKSRTGSTLRVIIPDADTAFKQYSRQAEHWLAFKDIIKNKIAPVQGRRSLTTQLINQKGTFFVDAWKQKTKDILYGEVNTANQLEKFLDTVVFRNLPFSLFSGKIHLFTADVLASLNMLIY